MGIKNLRRFRADLKKQADFPAELAERWTKNIALRAHFLIQDRTPIDTGRAIGSWNLSIGTANQRTLPKDFNKRRDATTALAAPGLAQVSVLGHKLGGSLFVANSVPYILFLEGGSSQQAPAGMVTVGINQLRGQLASLDPRKARILG